MTAHRAAGHPTLSDEEVADRWGDLKRTGVRREDAATRLGMTHADLTRTLTRVRDHARTAELKRTSSQPEPLTRDELVREWDEVLRPSGYSFADAAERLGMHPVTFENHIRGARDSGDERATPPAVRFGAVYGPVHDNNRGTVSNPVWEWGGKWAQADEQAKERVALLVGDEDRDTAGYLRAVREGTVTGGTTKTEQKAEPVANQSTVGDTSNWTEEQRQDAELATHGSISDVEGALYGDPDDHDTYYRNDPGYIAAVADIATQREEVLRWEHTDIHTPSSTDADEAVTG